MTTNVDIKNILHQYRETVFNKDLEKHLDLYAADVCIFDMWDEWSMQGLEPLRKMVTEWFSSLGDERVGVEWEDEKISVQGDMGYAAAIVKFSGLSADGKVLRWLQNRFSIVVQRRDGKFKIIHQHTSGPVDSQTMKTKMQR